MEEALYRLKLAADAGADVCFIEGVKTSELLKQTVAALAPKPVLVNVISGGLTPAFTYKEAEEMGAKIISKFLSPLTKVSLVNTLIQSSPLSPASPWYMLCALPCTRSRKRGPTLPPRKAWTRRRSLRSWA